MGLDYAYQFWVPESRLFDFLALAQRYSDERVASVLHFPDGRTLPFNGYSIGYKGESPQQVPLDAGYSDSLCCVLTFEPDGVLEDYPTSEDGKFRIGCLYLGLGLAPTNGLWCESEERAIFVSLTAATTGISRRMEESPSMRRLFLELAREGGASACLLDCEGNGDKLLFLDGLERNEDYFAGADLFDLRAKFSGFSLEGAAARLMSWPREIQSAHDWMAMFDAAQNDPDSGIRTAACGRFRYVKDNLLEVTRLLIEVARNDPDWRVRFAAYQSLEGKTGTKVESALLGSLKDPNPQVRIAGIHTLKSCQFSNQLSQPLSPVLTELLQKTPPQGSTMGLFLTTMKTLSLLWSEKQAALGVPIIQNHLQIPNFPFVHEAKEALERLIEFPIRFPERMRSA